MIKKYDVSGMTDEEASSYLLKLANETSQHDIESFSILFECIRFNQHRLVSIVRKESGAYVKKYLKLCAEIKKRCLLPKKKCLLNQFYNHRSYVVHDIFFNRNFDDEDLKKWFEEGQRLNLRLLVEIRKRTTIYGEILQS